MQDIKINKIYMLIVLFWILVFFVTGTLWSGYHLVDDLGHILYFNDAHNDSFWNALVRALDSDLQLRYRPLYMSLRVLYSYILGPNFILLSILNLFYLIATSIFLFKFSDFILKNNRLALSFVFIALVGVQTASYWRLGPNETPGLLFTSMALYFISVFYQTYKFKYKVFWIMCAGIAALCKESFVIFLFSYPFIILFIDSLQTQNDFKASLKNHLFEFTLIAIFFVINLFAIYKVTSTGNNFYAGVDHSSLSLKKIYKANFMFIVKSYGIVALLSIFAILLKQKKNLSRSNFYLILCFLAIILPQLALYTKSGYFERYLIPGTLASAFVITFFLAHISSYISNSKIKTGFIILVGFFFVRNFDFMFQSALNFSYEGRVNKDIFNLIDSNSEKKSVVVFLSDENEYTGSIEGFLKQKHSEEELNFKNINTNKIDPKIFIGQNYKNIIFIQLPSDENKEFFDVKNSIEQIKSDINFKNIETYEYIYEFNLWRYLSTKSFEILNIPKQNQELRKFKLYVVKL